MIVKVVSNSILRSFLPLMVLILSCSGCTLNFSPAPAPVQRKLVVNYVAQDPRCERAFWNAQTYLQSEGILLLKGRSDYSYTMICIPPRPLLLSFLPSVEGQAYPKVGYFQASRSEDQTTKTLLHELGHVLGARHSTSGIMTPVAEVLPFATGFSKVSLQEMGVLRPRSFYADSRAVAAPGMMR